MQTPDSQLLLYVSTDGKDTWSGRLPAPNAAGTDGPFATLTRARDAIRRTRAADRSDSAVTVMVLDGTHFLDRPLSLESQDGGTAAQPITYTAYPGDRPVLSGGKVITRWRPYQGEIVQCALPEARAGRWMFRQLFFNGQRQVRARWPNYDPDDPLYGGWAFIEATLPEGDQQPTTFRYQPGPSPREWARPAQAEVNIFPWKCWVNDIIPVKQGDAGARTIELSRQAHYEMFTLTPGNRFIVENMLEELDQPGEWCLDSDTGTVYFWPPNGPVESGEVTVPVTDRLIELRGSPEEPIRHITISGLNFTQTLSPFPEHQHPSNFHSPTLRGEAVRLENAEDCRVENNVFYAVGGDGVRLHGYNARNRVSDNEIAYAGGAGISLASDGPMNTNVVADKALLKQYSGKYPKSVRNVISNNHIHHCGVIKKNGGAVQLCAVNSVDNVVSHNLIHQTSDKGIMAQDGFGRITVEFNEMHHLALEISDTGGIMTNRWYVIEEDEDLRHGNIFRYNLISDVIGCGAYGRPREGYYSESTRAGGRIWTPYFNWGIYFDNSGTDITVFGNIIVRAVQGSISMPVGSPRNNLIKNNIAVDCMRNQVDLRIGAGSEAGGEAASGNRFVGNIVYYTGPNAALLAINRGTRRALAECDRNVYYPAAGQQPVVDGAPDGSFDRWREMGLDTHSIIADPLFVDPASDDYRLRPDSPAFELGFQPIDVARIGLETRTTSEA